MQEPIDVLIVGGGLVGLTLVNALRGSRLSVRLIDGQSPPQLSARAAGSCQGHALVAGVSPRVSAINLASEALLKRIGAWPAPAAQQCAYNQMSVWDSRGTASIQFDADLAVADHLGTIIENDQLTQALFDRGLSVDEAQIDYDHGVGAIERIDGGYRVSLVGGESISCKLLVGCGWGRVDGASVDPGQNPRVELSAGGTGHYHRNAGVASGCGTAVLYLGRRAGVSTPGES